MYLKDVVYRVALGLLFAAIIAPGLGQKLDGHLFPVAGPAVITKAVSIPGGRTIIQGRAPKNRQCSFIAIDWRMGDHEHYVSVPVEFRESQKLRDAGPFAFGDWVVDLDRERLLTKSYAMVYHQCFVMGFPLPWTTETLFYQS